MLEFQHLSQFNKQYNKHTNPTQRNFGDIKSLQNIAYKAEDD